MKCNTLGRTGLKVPALSFGASSLGGAVHEVAVSEAIETVHAAMDLGFNFVDVSPYYSGTVAELILGRALRGIRRDRYCLATKVGRYAVDYFDFSAERVRRSVDESLSRLGLDYVDLIQCHDIEFGSLNQIVEETIPALQKLREQGKVRYIGITGLPLKVFEEVVRHSSVDTILSYCHYALNDTALAGLLPFLTGKASRHHQCLAFQHGTADEPRRSNLASGASSSEGALQPGCRILPRPRRRSCQAGPAILPAKSEYPHDLGGNRKSREFEEERGVGGGAGQ